MGRLEAGSGHYRSWKGPSSTQERRCDSATKLESKVSS